VEVVLVKLKISQQALAGIEKRLLLNMMYKNYVGSYSMLWKMSGKEQRKKT